VIDERDRGQLCDSSVLTPETLIAQAVDTPIDDTGVAHSPSAFEAHLSPAHRLTAPVLFGSVQRAAKEQVE
jgi:hypothetical protein